MSERVRDEGGFVDEQELALLTHEETALDRYHRVTADLGNPILGHLGGEALEMDEEAGECLIAFAPRDEFFNPFGSVQGGVVAGMLDSTAAIAAVAKSRFTVITQTLELKTSYVMPVVVHSLKARGRCIRLGRSVIFSEADLFDDKGRLLARASMTGRPVPLDEVRALKRRADDLKRKLAQR